MGGLPVEVPDDEEPRRAYDVVLTHVEEGIATGRLRVGSRLPSERDLAGELGVSRASVREAVRVLESMGVLHTTAGKGPDGGSLLTAGSSFALTRLLKLHIGLTNFPMPDVIETRVMLERWSSRLAAQFATTEDIDRLRATLDALREPGLDRHAFNDLDTQFHVLIAEASHNRMVADMTIAIRDAMSWWIRHSFEDVVDWDDLATELNAGHAAVFEEIAAHRPIKAADRIEAHIRSAYAALLWSRDRG